MSVHLFHDVLSLTCYFKAYTHVQQHYPSLDMFIYIRLRIVPLISWTSQWALYAALAGDVLADLGITVSLCLLLNRMRSGLSR